MTAGAKIGLSVGVVGLAVGYLVVSTVSGGEALEYYKHVDEVMAAPADWTGRKVQLHGNVVQGSILKKRGTMDFRFAMHKHRRWLEVTYSGLVPDAFKDCAELVVHGKLGADRVFRATSISAKCPSKYEGKLRTEGCGETLLPEVAAARGDRAAPPGS